MRRFKNADKAKQIELTAQFPDLYKLQCVEETQAYTYGAVSVFDHWLDRKEAAELLENVPTKIQKQRNNALHIFSKKIASEFEIFNFKFNGKWGSCRPLFRHFTSTKAAFDYLTPATCYSSSYFFRIVIPEINAVFFESWDDTNVFYLRDPSAAKTIKPLAQECGIHYLEKWT